MVKRAVWSPATPTGVEVAVKSLEGSLTEEDRVKFLQEAAIMGQFKHPNVIRIFGVISTSDPVRFCIMLTSQFVIKSCYDFFLSLKLMIVCELMHKGDLHQYLLSLRPRYVQYMSIFCYYFVYQ